MDFYEKNLEALKKHHPELVDLVEATVIGQDRVKLFYSETGDPRLLYKKDDGEEIYIHSAEDPQKCANQAVDLLGKMEKEGIAVLFGFGLGYFAEEILKRFEKGHILLIYEATPELFKTALKTRDLSELLESKKISIVLGENADNFYVIHQYYHFVIHGKLWLVKHHPSVKINEASYTRFQRRLMEEKRLADTGVGTMIGLGKEFINTLMANVPHVIRKPGVSKLKDIFKGRPAILVSAGPSLEKNFHLLRQAKGKAIIIAVDVVLPTLLPAGIVPDILVAIDPLPNNMAVFRDNPILKKVPFICLAQYTPEIVNIYPGPIFINSVPSNIIYQWLSGFWEDKGYVECFGGSVSHLAFGAAEYLGADVIALIGQDLSYTEKLHVGDTTDMLHAFHGQDTPDYTKGAESVVDIFGEKKYTLSSLLSFKTSFENKIKRFSGTVIQATEGGLPIEGTRVIRLDDFIREYCNLPEIDTFTILTGLANSEVSYNLEGLIFQVRSAREIFSNINKNALRILKYIYKVKKVRDKGEKDSPYLYNTVHKIEELAEKVKHPILNIIVSYHYQLELYLKGQISQSVDEIDDIIERLDKQLWRGLNYYGELIEAVTLFLKQLDGLIKALEREAKVNALLMDESVPEGERFYSVGMLYKKAGIVTQAINYLERTYNPDECTSDSKTSGTGIAVSLAEMYIRQFRFYEAKELIVSAKGRGIKGRGQAQKIEDLLKTCDEKIMQWEERKEKMGKALEEAEKNYGGSLESGYFYFRVKDYERSEKAYIKAIEEAQPTVGADAGAGLKAQGNAEPGTKNIELVNAYYGLAHTYLAQEKIESAVEALEKAIEVDPKNPLLYRDLGFIAFQSNNMEAAEMFFIKALELAPQDIELYKTLVNLYVGVGDIEKATALYEDALLANPNNPAIQKDIAMLYKEMITKTGRA